MDTWTLQTRWERFQAISTDANANANPTDPHEPGPPVRLSITIHDHASDDASPQVILRR